MSDIEFPSSPRPQEDPHAAGVVMENLRFLGRMFHRGAAEGDILVWDIEGQRWQAVPLTLAIPDGSITAAMIGAGAVGSSELADGAVDTAAIQDSAVNAAKIATGAVGADEIAAGAVGNSELANGTVDTAHFASTAIAPDATLLDGLNGLEYLRGRTLASVNPLEACIIDGGFHTVGEPAVSGAREDALPFVSVQGGLVRRRVRDE